MELRLIDKGKTQIKVSKKNYLQYKTLIDTYIMIYGGEKGKENSRWIYFTINTDLLNRKR